MVSFHVPFKTLSMSMTQAEKIIVAIFLKVQKLFFNILLLTRPDQESSDYIFDSKITDLIELLKQEVERMRIETGEIANNSDGYNGIHHLQYNQQNFFRNQK